MARTYEPDDDLVHLVVDNPAFQDSHWLMWHDAENGIGGFHRLGVSPTQHTAAFVCGIVTKAGDRFRATDWNVPWTAPRGATYAVSENCRIALHDGGWRLWVREPDCEVNLTWQGWGSFFFYGAEATIAASHFEGAGSVTGTVRLGGRTYDVDAMAFRDRSWGPRDYSAVLAHRWFAGTFGPDLTFSAITLLLPDGRLHCDGVVVRDGSLIRATDVDIVIHQEADGFSHRGGTLRLRFADADDFVVEACAVDGIAFALPAEAGYSVDTLCTATHQERQGFCNVEATNNVHRVTVAGCPVPLSIAVAIDNGLSRRRQRN